MKIRIASTVALAAALTLGMTGCNLIAPQATLDPYAPSDGRDIDVDSVDVRNILLIADETGENFNVVFSSVNLSGSEQPLSISFVGENGASASAEFTVPTGNTRFGNPEGEPAPVLVTLPGTMVGSTVTAYLQNGSSAEVEYEIPVLDGELVEYREYVLPADFSKNAEDEAEGQLANDEQAADETPAGDDEEGAPE